jgi:hypothetical protein
MYFLSADNQKLCQENQALTKINELNVSYIAQIERELRDIKDINKGLNEGLNKELNRKKKWRNATLLLGSVYVLTILALAQL